MEDKRKNNGGAREGAGRPKKIDEEKTSILAIKAMVKKWGSEGGAFERLADFADEGSYNHFKSLLEYGFGKPQDKIDVTTNGDSVDIPVIGWVNGSKKGIESLEDKFKDLDSGA